eukprot:CAMPEP_0115394108 /NCGR_PEP_ID=MMETSP0271-20121206/12095_1 /TAXON_ID=71861 /ORGANISM="Scrippsiella trochoidea, Strain CCMP3099" /LENGTH=380 /DNA_ID=CAMNT_0002817767 /DNA_START=84 /DNA_END=1226 /DNA_ORIENTATION=+
MSAASAAFSKAAVIAAVGRKLSAGRVAGVQEQGDDVGSKAVQERAPLRPELLDDFPSLPLHPLARRRPRGQSDAATLFSEESTPASSCSAGGSMFSDCNSGKLGGISRARLTRPSSAPILARPVESQQPRLLSRPISSKGSGSHRSMPTATMRFAPGESLHRSGTDTFCRGPGLLSSSASKMGVACHAGPLSSHSVCSGDRGPTGTAYRADEEPSTEGEDDVVSSLCVSWGLSHARASALAAGAERADLAPPSAGDDSSVTVVAVMEEARQSQIKEAEDVWTRLMKAQRPVRSQVIEDALVMPRHELRFSASGQLVAPASAHVATLRRCSSAVTLGRQRSSSRGRSKGAAKSGASPKKGKAKGKAKAKGKSKAMIAGRST